MTGFRARALGGRGSEPADTVTLLVAALILGSGCRQVCAGVRFLLSRCDRELARSGANGDLTMLWTLQTYVFRELGKTFLLTATGLTAVIALGGGLFNLIGVGEITPTQLVRLMAVIVPVAGTLTLPIAALFSATASYGRLSADNEFTACRSSGINIHTLFLPAIVISVVSAVLTFAFLNFVIPGLLRHMNLLTRRDLPVLVEQALRSPQRLGFKNDRYRVFAERLERLAIDPAAAEGGVTGGLQLSGVAFIEIDRDEWVRFGLAEAVNVVFGESDGLPTVAADMVSISGYDRREASWFAGDEQNLGAMKVPRDFPLKIKWLGLGELLRARRRPERLRQLQQETSRLRTAAAEALFYRSVAERGGAPLVLGDGRLRYELSAGSLATDAEDGRTTFYDVTIVENRDGRSRTIKADRATLDFERGEGDPDRSGTLGLALDDPREHGPPPPSTVAINVFDHVSMTDPDNPARTIQRHHEQLDPVPAPREFVAAAERLDDATLFDPTRESVPGERFARRRDKLIAVRAAAIREITSVLHQRATLSVSVLVLVILGAALGIHLRGAHVLVAFLISFVPAVFVLVTIITGKRLTENPDIATLGLGVMWSGIATVTLLDVWVLARVLRR